MQKIIQFLTSKIKYLVYLYALIQLTLILITDISFHSDALYYYNLAQECINVNEFYPAEQHLYEDYIFAPLYINAIILLLKISNSTFTIALFNFLISLLQILILYIITEKLFSANLAKLTVLLYILYLNTLGLVLTNYTELFFLLIISVSILLYLQNKNYYLILSGIALGAAIAVRPAGWALFLAFFILQVYKGYKIRKLVPSYFYIYIGVFIFIIVYGGWTYSHFGKFEFTSTTGPVNLLIGANDNATGGFNATVFEKGNQGFIESPDTLNYLETGEFYQNQALEWIVKHPVKWISLAPLKFIHTFGWDDIALSSLLGYSDLNFGRALKNILDGKEAGLSVYYFLFFSINHIYYYLILVSIILSIIHLKKNNLSEEGIKLILLYSLISIFIIMIVVGTPRYKYPVFILLLPFAAYYLQMMFGLHKQVSENEEY
jgi:hypothetical protein